MERPVRPGPHGPGVFSFITLGCKSNQYDSAAMARDLELAGMVQGPVEKAGVIVVNTCMVTGPTEAQCRKAIRQARRANGDARIIVAGCMSSGVRDRIEVMDEVDLIVETSEKGRLPHLLGMNGPARWLDWPDDPAVDLGVRDRGFLKIQDGCNAGCTYCVVPSVRGRSRSLEPVRVLKAIRRLMDRGMAEVVLSGIHLGQYGKDLDPGSGIEILLEMYLGEMMPGRVRLSSIEPLEINSRLVGILAAAEGRICRHIHIPLQSGSDRILAAMERPYCRDQFVHAVNSLVGTIPGIGIGCDVICGFPGESDEDFQETRDLIERLRIPFIHAFPFSARPGTKAAAMKDDIPQRVKKARVSLLRKIAEDNRIRFARSFIGCEIASAMESSTDSSGDRLGLTDNYLRVAVKEDGTALAPGRIIDVLIDGQEGDTLRGHSLKRNLQRGGFGC